VTRTTNPADARSLLVGLTPDGLTRLREARSGVGEGHARSRPEPELAILIAAGAWLTSAVT
jgi:DNA-binding MarR family transcriptional regulator